MQVYFDVRELYYIPQLAPICSELTAVGAQCCFLLYDQESLDKFHSVVGLECSVYYVDSVESAISHYQAEKPDWVVFGNTINSIERMHEFSKTALLSDGIGPKPCYYTVSDVKPSVRFVEGPYRTQRLQELYPEQTFIDTGYAKLDPIIKGEYNHLKPSDYGLDNAKKTLLYAPSFFPSSIECLSKNFPKDFSEYNIILKPHYFSLVSKKYKKQRVLLEYWNRYENVYLAYESEVNIAPFMAISDVLISDASSTLFEFSALDKPVVWCDFYKLRLGYRGIFKFRFKERMDQDLYKYADIAVHAESYRDLKKCVDSQVQEPSEKAQERIKYTEALAGKVDGKVSERIAQYIVNVGSKT